MFKQCWQVFLTYTRRWIFWIVFVAFVIGCGILLNGLFGLRRGSADNNGMPHWFAGAIFFIYYFGMIVYQLKEQIAVPQASIIPGYRVPHLVTALVMTLPVLVAAPVVLSVGLGWPILPLLSLNVGLCALVTWGICRNSWIAMLLAVGCFIAPQVPKVHTLFLNRFVTDHSLENSLAALAVLALGIMGIVLMARRLLALREEMPEYPKRVVTNRSIFSTYSDSVAMAPQVNYDSWWMRWQFSSNAREITDGGRPGALLGAGFWRRVAHRRAAYVNRGMVKSLLMMLAIIFIIWNKVSARNETFIGSSFLYIMPVYLAFVQQYARWPILGYESLQPVKRKDFILENAAGLAWSVGEAWFLMAAVLVAVAALLRPEILAELWEVLATSAIVQLLTLPMGWWLMRLRSRAVLIGIAMGWGVMFTPIAVFARNILQAPPAWIAAGAGALALVGAVIALDAYRRWMRVDLG